MSATLDDGLSHVNTTVQIELWKSLGLIKQKGKSMALALTGLVYNTAACAIMLHDAPVNMRSGS
jgi:hypothetical protein